MVGFKPFFMFVFSLSESVNNAEISYKLYYKCYEIQEDKQEFVLESNGNWLSILSDDDEPDLYIEPSETLNRVLYALVKKERINLFFKIIFEDKPEKSPYKLSKKGEHLWGSYLYVKNVLLKPKE
jgi:hypothetical protein